MYLKSLKHLKKVSRWDIATNVSNKITYTIKLIKNPAFIAKSKDLLGEYNKTKETRYAMAMCYYIALRGNQVNPNYCTNWQFVAYQRITCAKITTETLKTSSDIVHG